MITLRSPPEKFLAFQNVKHWVTTPSDPQGEWQFQKLKAAENDINSALWWHHNGEWKIPFNLRQFKHQPKTYLVAHVVLWSPWFRLGSAWLSCPLSPTALNITTPSNYDYASSATSCPSSRALHQQLERLPFKRPCRTYVLAKEKLEGKSYCSDYQKGNLGTSPNPWG